MVSLGRSARICGSVLPRTNRSQDYFKPLGCDDRRAFLFVPLFFAQNSGSFRFVLALLALCFAFLFCIEPSSRRKVTPRHCVAECWLRYLGQVEVNVTARTSPPKSRTTAQLKSLLCFPTQCFGNNCLRLFDVLTCLQSGSANRW